MAETLLSNHSKGLIFVLSAPAGTGKTTLIGMLKKEFPQITQSVSCTTRPPRPTEVEGKDYYFLSRKEFDDKIKAGDFLEYAQVFDYYYGTSKAFVLEQQKKGLHVFLVIDTQGAMLLKGKIDATFIFVSPPNLEELKRRLQMRKTENESSLKERLSWAQKEMETAKNYDYHFINDDLETAYQILRSIVIAEDHRVSHSRDSKTNSLK